MAIYRGPGGAGDATNDATSQAILAAASAVAAANSEAAAAGSASDAAGYAASINPADLVHISGTETITGPKTFSTNPTISSGTANGVAYLNGSKVLTTSSALTFDGTNLGIGTSSPSYKLQVDGASTAGFVTPLVAKNPSTNAASSVKIGLDCGGTVWGEIGASYNTNDPYMAFFVRSGSEKMRLTDAGNLGLGVTPSAWVTGKAIQVGTTGTALWGYTDTTFLTQNAAGYSANFLYGTSAPAAGYRMQSGAHAWYTAPSGTAGNAISFTQALTLTANGNLLLGGTSEPSTGKAVLYIANAATVPSTNPSGGGVLYVEGGALKYRGSSGTITTLGAA